MKVNIKTGWIAISVGILLVLSIIGILVWSPNHSKQEVSKSIINSVDQKISTGSLKQSLSRPSSSDESANQLVGQLTRTQEEKGKQVKKADTSANTSIDPMGGVSQATTDPKATPAELLQKYLDVTDSPEFIEEIHNVSVPLEAETYPYLDQIKELENKEKELERDLETASSESKSKIQSKLDDVKTNLWETRVEYFEKVTLLGDAVHRVFLNHFTNEEIKIAREEMWRTMAPPAGAFMNDEAKELSKKAAREAIVRLKAKGWVPANPDERWYVN